MTLPWLPFFLASIWDFIKNNFPQRRKDAERKSEFLSPLLLFSFSPSPGCSCRSFSFRFPARNFPVIFCPHCLPRSILTAEYVFRFVAKSRRRKIVVQSIGSFDISRSPLSLCNFSCRISLPTIRSKFLIETANATGYATRKNFEPLHTFRTTPNFTAREDWCRDETANWNVYYGVFGDGRRNETRKRKANFGFCSDTNITLRDSLTESSLVEVAKFSAINGDTATRAR